MARERFVGQNVLLWTAVLLLGAPLAHAGLQVQPVELEIQGNAAQPSVAVDPKAGFVLTWQERGPERAALHFAVVDAQGTEIRRGTAASGSDWFVNGADFPSLVVLDNGDWVTHWLQKTSPGTYSYEIRSVRSRDGGKSWDTPVTIHRDGTDTEHGFVAMSSAGGDRVQFAWFDGRRMAGADPDAHEGAAEHMTLRTAMLGRDGKLVQEQELDDLTCSCCQTDAVRGGSRTLLVYRDRTEQEIRDIGTLVYSAGHWTKPGRVHADDWKMPGCPVNGPAVVARDDRFSVLWPTMAGGEMKVRLAHGDGTTFEAPQLLAGGSAELGRVDLATWGTTGFLASRVRQGQGATELVVDELDAAGRPVSQASVATKVGGFPRMARLGDVVLLAWAEAGAATGTSRVGVARITAGPGATPGE
jgi:hypothetical protein